MYARSLDPKGSVKASIQALFLFYLYYLILIPLSFPDFTPSFQSFHLSFSLLILIPTLFILSYCLLFTLEILYTFILTFMKVKVKTHNPNES